MRKNLRHSTDSRPITVLGVDPGTLVTGYGIVACRGAKMRLVDCGTIRNGSEKPMPSRLHEIYYGLRTLMEEYAPDEFAIESAFYGKNAQSAMKLGHARGVSLLAAVERGIPTAEYSPREVKKAITGRGSASKEQVQFMIRSLLDLGETPMIMDASDALAIAVCHLHRFRTPALKPRDWKSFVAAHPDRVRK